MRLLTQIQSQYHNTADKLSEQIDGLGLLSRKVTRSAKVVVETALGTSAVVVGLTAPIPVAVGLVLLGIYASQATQSNKRDEEASEIRKNLRKAKALLRKYGKKLPQTGEFETKYLKMVIDLEKNSVEGEVVHGEFLGRKLSELSREQLDILCDNCDEQSKETIALYRKIDDFDRTKYVHKWSSKDE